MACFVIDRMKEPHESRRRRIAYGICKNFSQLSANAAEVAHCRLAWPASGQCGRGAGVMYGAHPTPDAGLVALLAGIDPLYSAALLYCAWPLAQSLSAGGDEPDA